MSDGTDGTFRPTSPTFAPSSPAVAPADPPSPQTKDVVSGKDDKAQPPADPKYLFCAMEVADKLSPPFIWENAKWRDRVFSYPDGVPLEDFAVVLGDLDKESVLYHLQNDSRFKDKVKVNGTKILPLVTKDDDPVSRTIHVGPIPFRATNADITSFFEHWGKVEKIDRPYWKQRGGNPRMKKPFINVTFADLESVDKIIAEQPQYAEVSEPMFRHFVLPLKTERYKPHIEVIKDDNYLAAKAAGVRKRGITVTEFQELPAPKVSPAAKTLSPIALNFLDEKYISVLSGIPPGTGWRDVREYLQVDFGFAKKRFKPIAFILYDEVQAKAWVFFKTEELKQQAEKMTPPLFKGTALTLKGATDKDMDYLKSLPCSSTPQAPKRVREETAIQAKPYKKGRGADSSF